MKASSFYPTMHTEDRIPVEKSDFNKLGYRPELDGFRGISIILVFIHHLYHPILPGGFLGVDMFFVLSGFLITSLLLEEVQTNGAFSLKNFYIRRAFRLMPAVCFLILVLAVYALFFLDAARAEKTYQGIWLTLFYTSNWFYAFNLASADNPLGVTWSLAIEEQFYLIFPVLLYFALRFRLGNRRVISILVLSIISVTLHRKMLADGGAVTQRLYYAADTRADALLIGCLTAFLFSRNLFPFKKFEKYVKISAVAAVVFLLSMFATATWSDAILYSTGFYTFVAFSVSLILIAILVYKPQTAVKILSFYPLVWIGRVSYGLYLWHWAVRYFAYGKQMLPESVFQLALVVFISFAFTVFSYYCIEVPFLRLKSRFGQTTSPAVTI